MENQIYNKITDLTAFKILAVIVMLAGTNYYTHFIYQYGIFIVVGWGCLLVVSIAYKREKIKDRSVFLLMIFLLGGIITILNNFSAGAARQGFVLLTCLVYFLLFYSPKLEGPGKTEKDIKIISGIIICYTLVIGAVSLLLFMLKQSWIIESQGIQYNIIYSVRGYNMVQFIGIYNGNSTCATCAAISVFLSLQQLYDLRKKSLKILLMINIVLQYLIVLLSDSITGIIALDCGIIVFVIFIIKNTITESSQKKAKRIIKAGVIAILTVVVILGSGNIKEQFYTYFFHDSIVVVDNEGKHIEQTETVAEDDSVSKEKDNAPKQFEISSKRNYEYAFKTGTGRYEIWKAGIEFWKSSPIFGRGYGTFYTSLGSVDGINLEFYNLHNGYLEVLVCNGLVGAISIGLFGLYHIFRSLRRCIKENNIKLHASFALITVLLTIAMAQQTFIMDRGLAPMLLCIYLGYCSYLETKGNGHE